MQGIESTVRSLVDSSVLARKKAYAPYSKFPVGAALLCTDGTVVLGCNVENASFGLTVCAERTAIVKAVSDGKTHFDAIAISAVFNEEFVSPCGACRQTLSEFNPRMKVYLHNPMTDRVAFSSMSYLLPAAFCPESCPLDMDLSNGCSS